MRNINDLVSGLDPLLPKTFQSLKDRYNGLSREITRLGKWREHYDDLYQNGDPNSEGLSFRDKMNIYYILDNIYKKNSSYMDIDVYTLIKNLVFTNPAIEEYINIIEKINYMKEQGRAILSEGVNFSNFGDVNKRYDYENVSDCFMDKHYLVYIEGELFCVKCGASTKDYDITKDDKDFLILCAKSQGILLDEVTKDDLPLLEVLMNGIKERRINRIPLSDVSDADYHIMAEEYFLEDESILPFIRRAIRKAHILDSKKYADRTGLSETDAKKSFMQLVQEGIIEDVAVTDPRYLSGERLEQLQNEILKRIDLIERSNNENKTILLQECLVMKYELAILSGTSIPELLKSSTSEEDKILLVKAYLNISSQSYRINSRYFKSESDAVFYECVTANPDINRRVLEMKLGKL